MATNEQGTYPELSFNQGSESVGQMKEKTSYPEIDYSSDSDVPTLNVAYQNSIGSGSDQAAKVLKLADTIGVPSDFVKENYDELDREYKKKGFDAEAFRQTNPKLAEWVAKDPNHYSFIQDDLSMYATLEKSVKSFGQGFGSAFDSWHMGDLLYKEMETGQLTPQEQRSLDYYKSEVEKANKFSSGSAFATGTNWMGNTIGQFLTATIASLPQMTTGMASGAAIGTYTYPGLGTAGGAVGGAISGRIAGSFEYTRRQEAAFAFDQLKNTLDENGKPIDRETARIVSHGIGLINAAIESVSDAALAKLVPGVKEAIGIGNLKKAIANPTARQALLAGIKTMNEGGLIEGAEEVLQSLVSSGGREVAQAVDGKTYAPDSFSQDVKDALSQGLQAYVGTSLTGGLLAGSVQFHGDVRAVAQAKRNEAFFNAIHEGAQNSKTMELLPEKAQEAVKAIVKDGPVETVWANAEDVQTYFQAKGMDAAAVLDEVMPDGAKAFREALDRGGDIAIPTDKYATTIARDKNLIDITQHLKTNENDLSAFEAKKIMEERKAEIQKKAEAATQTGEAVAEDIGNQLKQAGRSSAEIGAMQDVYAARYTARASRRMLQETAKQAYDLSNIQVKQGVPTVIQKAFQELGDFEPKAKSDLVTALTEIRKGIKEPKIKAPSLFKFVKSQGGLKLDGTFDGELKNLGGKLVKDSGKTLDQMRESAVENGYLDAGSTIDDFLVLLDKESRGEKVYPTGSDSEVLVQKQRADELKNIQDFLEKNGINVSEMTNPEILKKIKELNIDPYNAPKESDVFLQSAKNLIIQHNLTASNLKFANDLGGLPAPSLAITKIDSPLTNFGEITLLGSKKMADPKNGAKVFGADIYSPRYPDTVYKFSKKGVSNISNFFSEETKATDEYFDVNEFAKDPIPYLHNKSFAMLRFLKSNNVEPNIKFNIPDQSSLEFIEKYGLKKYFGVADYNLRSDKKFVADISKAQIAQWKKDYGKDSKEVIDAFKENLGYRDRIVREWSNAIDNAHKAQNNPAIDAYGTRDSLRDQIKELGLDQMYMDYLDSLVKAENPKIKIKKVSDYGNVRLIDHSLENVVRELKNGIRGGENFNYGVGSVRAMHTPKFNSIEKIKKESGRLVSEKEFDVIKDEINKELFSLADKIQKFHSTAGENSFRYLDAVTMMLQDSAKMGIPTALTENSFSNVDMSSMQLIGEYLDKLKNLPTAYFEAKILRGLNISEFEAAVVPESISKNVLKILTDSGLEIVKYSESEGQESGIKKAAEKLGDRVLFQKEKNDPLGSTTVNPNGFTIEFFRKANLSTFLHESGHVWLFELIQDATEAGKGSALAKDLDTILNWMGLDVSTEHGAEAIKKALERKHHEKFAEGIEKYFMEGKAPSVGLRSVFNKYKVWLLSIYRSLKGIGVELNPEVREVFDRMLATDEEIQAVKEKQGHKPLFDDLGFMSEEERNQYAEILNKANEEASSNAAATFMRAIREKKTKEYQERFDAERNRIKEEVAQEKDQRTYSVIVKKTEPDGSLSNIDQNVELRLDRKSLIEGPGKEAIAKLPKGMVIREGGMDYNVVAGLFGYNSGAEFLMAMANVENFDAKVDRLTQEAMKSQYDELFNEDTIEQETQKAIHGQERSKFLYNELKHLASKEFAKFKGLAKTLTRRMDSLEEISMAAQLEIESTQIRDIRPNKYLVAERRASKAAFDAFYKGDLEGAFKHRMNELKNHERYKIAMEYQDKINSAFDLFEQIRKPIDQVAKTRDMNYVNAAKAILSSYGIGPKSFDAMAEIKKIRDYDGETYQNLESILIDTMMNQKDYREADINTFMGMLDTVQALWDLGRNEKTMTVEGQKILKETAIENLRLRLSEIVKPSAENEALKRSSNEQTKVKSAFTGFKARARRVESWVDLIDGGNINGPARTYIYQPIADAATQYRILKEKYVQRYVDLLNAHEENLKSAPIVAKELNGFVFDKKSHLIAALLHRGNLSNFSKLLRGYGWGELDPNTGILDSSRFKAFEERMQREGILTKADYDFVQKVWDMMEELKPAAQKAHKEMYGHYFNEVTANKFSTPFGEYKGGYVPAKADPFKSQDASIRSDKNNLESSGNSFSFPTTGRGSTKSRIEAYAAPLMIDLRMVTNHIDWAIKFATLEPRVKEVGRLLIDKQFRNIINEFDDAAIEGMLMPWVQRSATQRVETPFQGKGGAALGSLLKHLRSTAGMSTMVLNVSNSFQQFTGLALSNLKVDQRYLRNGLFEYMKSPTKLTDFVTEKSEFMKTRSGNQMFDVSKTIDELATEPTALTKAQDFGKKHGYVLAAMAQNVVDMVTWQGAYEQAIEQGLSDADAIKSADAAVRLTQGSFNPEDISNIETGSPFMRLFNMFASYFNMKANLLGTEFSKVMQDVGFKKGLPRLFLVYFNGMIMVPVLSALIAQAMSGRPIAEDDDSAITEYLKWLLGTQFTDIAAAVPGAGAVASLAINKFDSKPYNDKLVVSPVQSMLESAGSAPFSVYHALDKGKGGKAAIKDSLTALSLLSGVPVAPLSRPLGYLADVEEGKAKPSGPVDYARGLIQGSAGKK